MDGNETEPPSQTSTKEYVGWVKFRGEFLLYPDKKAAENGVGRGCLSGTLPLQLELDAAKKYDGTRVKVIAQPILWRLPSPLALSLNHEGAPVTNWCHGDTVLFAKDMIPLGD